MKFSDIKFGLYSLAIAVMALLLYSYNNYSAYQLYIEATNSLTMGGDQNATLIIGVTRHPLILSVIGFVFGIFGLINKKRLSILGTVVSFILIILSIFPIYVMFI